MEVSAELEADRRARAGENAEKDARIQELEEELRFKASLRHERNACWSDGDPNPYCSTCYEAEGKRVHLDIAPHSPAWASCNRCKKHVKIVDDGERWDQPLRRNVYRVPRLRDF